MIRELTSLAVTKTIREPFQDSSYASISDAMSNLNVYDAPVDRTVDFLEDVNVDVPGLYIYIDEHIDTAEIEADDYAWEIEHDKRPVVAAIWEYLARSDTWATAKYQQHSARTIRFLKAMAAVSIYSFLVTLAGLMYGPDGFYAAMVLTGTAKLVDDNTKASLKPQIRRGLDATCSTCGAFPDMWCVTIKGNNPGTPTRNLHKPRLEGK